MEKTFGSFFYLRYSLLLIVSEALISFFIIYYARKIADTHPHFSIQFTMMTNFQSFGCSGLALGWLAFLSFFHGPLTNNHIILFGLFKVSLWYAPLVMIVIYYLCMLKGNLLYNWGGLLSGYLLALGALRLLPDMYWSVCFIADIVFIAIASIVSDRLLSSGEDDNNDNSDIHHRANSSTNNEIIEVIALPVSNERDGEYERMDQPHTIDGNEFDVEEVKENDWNNGRASSSMIPMQHQMANSATNISSSSNSGRYFRLNDDADMNPV